MTTEIVRLPGKDLSTEEMILNLGPQHPSTHGVLRVILSLDGEVITRAEPDVGYLHRGTEKLAENRTYPQMLVISDRWDYLSAMSNNLVWCLAVENLMQIQVPDRAHYLRVIMVELNRIASHLVFFGTYGIDIGAYTPFLYAFREREKILDLFEEVSGARMTYNYIRIGGVMADLPSDWIAKCLSFLEWLKPRFQEYDTLLTENPIFKDRTQGIGILDKEKAISYGITGPNLRGSDMAFDIRKEEPYSCYNKLKFNIPTGKNGDCWDRYWVRVQEMKESVAIIEQAIAGLPQGDCNAKVPRIIRPPVGESYAQIEAPRGALGIYLVSDGADKPYRVHVRPPSFINLAVLQDILVGMKVADVIAILGSVDIVLGEVDR
ncbi:MAG: NADH-quinone oxidoreductase subunit D [Elusimicrobia bacterium]|nr:NADH-quinone oxidoreductase subunit D [Elusimicrobiota bacterium]MBI2916075.1 NADH-quinone oxidoreductase subunit D [Elusimicrobiota bacterium]MBI3012617.1 NADH-quinone oxidoreductase subunit D [Elusimicrobiota bacterium]